MIRYTAFSAPALAALSLLPFASFAAHAEGVNRPALIAQAEPPPQLEQVDPDEQAAPEEGEDDRKGKKSRKRDRDAAPPAPSANVPAEIEKKAPPPQERTEKRRKSADETIEPPQEPAQAATPVEQPSEEPPQRKRREQQAEPQDVEQPKIEAAPKREAQPKSESASEPEKATAPPPLKEQPKPQPQETKQQPQGTPQPQKVQETKAPPPARGSGAQRAGSEGNMADVKKGRRQRTEDGGKRTVIEEPGNRVIVKEGGQTTIRHDETERLRRTSKDVRREKRKDGTSVTIAVRPGGIEVYSVFGDDGRLQRRYRRGKDGREVNLIDNRRGDRDHDRGDRDHGDYDRGGRDRGHGGVGFYLDLRPPRVGIPRNRYIVEYDNASEDDVYDALRAPPVEELGRRYTLDEIRYNRNLRDRMRRIDLDTVNFAFGSWEVAPSQYDKLARVARAINRILDRRPDEMFLIEGHTDAVGSDIDNLTLSDRRAEEVAYILTETFNVPPENLVTQGYGEEFLKINTQLPERANRRVAARRITPLLSRR